MKLSHINLTMPPGSEPLARSFYSTLLGLPEIPKPAPLLSRGGVWFDAGGLDLHLSVDPHHAGPDALRHFGLACTDLPALRSRLTAAGVPTHDGRPTPWQRFFAHDPFGNRIEFHEPDALRA